MLQQNLQNRYQLLPDTYVQFFRVKADRKHLLLRNQSLAFQKHP